MLKFFRKIRQNLLMDNKTGKYFKYAFGEIILVVIGILIALQLNIIREKNDARKKEVINLNNILQDLNKEVIDLTYIIKFKESQSKASDTIIDFIEGKKSQDLISLNKNQFTSFIWRIHHPNNNSFNELKSSGQLAQINSNEIRQKLLLLESKYIELEMIEEHIKYEYHEFLYKKNINSIDYKLMFNSRNKIALNKNDSILLKKNIEFIKGDQGLKNTYVLASENNKHHAFLCNEILGIVNEVLELIKQDIKK